MEAQDTGREATVSRSRFWEPSASDNALFTGVRGIRILGSSELPWYSDDLLCHSAHTSPSHRSMLASLRGLLTLREGAGLLPALLLDWDSLPSHHQPREEEQPLHPGGKQARVPNHVPSQLPRRSPWQSPAPSSTTRSPSTPSNSGRRARTQAARCCSSTTTTRPTASVPCRTAIRSKKKPSRS